MQIADMAERAAAAGWCITTLAEQNGVSVPTLERFFHDTKQQCPREWINAERMRRACACLMAGRNVQETSGDVGYESQHGFSLAFKKFHGYPPSLHRKTMEDGKWKSKVEGRETRASKGRARHSVRAEPPQYAKSEIGNRKSEIIVIGRKSAFDKIKSNRAFLNFVGDEVTSRYSATLLMSCPTVLKEAPALGDLLSPCSSFGLWPVSNHPSHSFPIQFHQGMLLQRGDDLWQMPFKE